MVSAMSRPTCVFQVVTAFLFFKFLGVLSNVELQTAIAVLPDVPGCSSVTEAGCCEAFDDAILTAFERRLHESDGDEQRLWKDRQECLAQRRTLESLCESENVAFRGDLQACTRGPGVKWGQRPDALTDEAMGHLRDECRSQRYLLWTRGNDDFYAGHSHKSWAFGCYISEALALQRTLIYEDVLAIGGEHVTGNAGVAEGLEVPMRMWWSEGALGSLPAVSWRDFIDTCGIQGVFEGPEDIADMPVNTQFSVMEASKAPLLVRNFTYLDVEGTHFYGYSICDKCGVRRRDDTWKYMQQSGSVVWPVDHILGELARAAKAHRTNVTCLHVRRGDKIGRSQYPHLDADTRPEAILKTLRPLLPKGNVVYIATNEVNPGAFYAPLAKEYNLFTFDNFTDAAPGLLPPTVGLIEYSVLHRCPNMIPTFREESGRGNFARQTSLTRDCKTRESCQRLEQEAAVVAAAAAQKKHERKLRS